MASNNSTLRWAIDLKWYDENGKSFVAVAASRLCSDCQAARREAPKAASNSADAQSILEATSQCCSLNRGYITPYTPVKEAVFRIFLAGGNKPLPTEQLLSQLQARLSPSNRLGILTPKAMDRILQNDRLYGFRPAPEAEAAPTLSKAPPEAHEDDGVGEATALVPSPEAGPSASGEGAEPKEEAADS